MNSRPTVKDIAKYVGVSTTTVSNVLNNRDGRVSDEIIQRVQEAVDILGYKKNYSALSLVSNKSNLIGVIIPQTEGRKELLLYNPFYAEFIGTLEYKLREAGYHMILSGSSNDEKDVICLESWNLDGIIILGIYDDLFYQSLKYMDIPIVLVDSYIKDDYFYKVKINDEEGGYIATKYLIEKGHKHIGFVTGCLQKEGVAQKRFQGYQRALKEYEIDFNKEYIFEKTVSYEWGYEVGRVIAANRTGITALFAIADIMASGLLSAFHEEKIQVPEDISIVGFDDTFIAKIATPPLTTINQDIHQKAEIAAKMMVNILAGHKQEENNVILSVSVTERNTVKEV